MRIGVTGSRRTPPPAQLLGFSVVLLDLQGRGAWELRHGACVGADEEMAVRASACGLWTVAHPPINERSLSSRALEVSDELEDADEYLARNRAIVDAVDVLVALPRRFVEERRSGTWATVRYARQVLTPVVIVWPDGTVDDNESVMSGGG